MYGEVPVKSDKIQLEIIKWLKLYPTHAYHLFQLLENAGVAKRSSEVYRIIKSMKQRDLIAARQQQERHGAAREVLRLTGKGESVYFSYYLSMLDLNSELIGNGRLTRLQDAIFRYFKGHFFDLAKKKQQKVLIELNLDWSDPLIGKVYRFFERYRDNFQVYMDVAGISTPPTSMVGAFSRRGNLVNRPRLRLHDMDFVVPIGYESRGLVEEGLSGKHSWLRQLKKAGRLCLPLSLGALGPNLEPYKRLVDDSPVDIKDSVSGRPGVAADGPGIGVPRPDGQGIEMLLRGSFKDVRRVQLAEGLDFFVASGLRNLSLD
jgi:DNA-binding PadR family transcriptional regulator